MESALPSAGPRGDLPQSPWEARLLGTPTGKVCGSGFQLLAFLNGLPLRTMVTKRHFPIIHFFLHSYLLQPPSFMASSNILSASVTAVTGEVGGPWVPLLIKASALRWASHWAEEFRALGHVSLESQTFWDEAQEEPVANGDTLPYIPRMLLALRSAGWATSHRLLPKSAWVSSQLWKYSSSVGGKGFCWGH